MMIVWSDRSIDRLLAIHDYIAKESSHGAASVIQQIFDSVEQVRMFPKSGRLVPEYAEIEVREILSTPIVFFNVYWMTALKSLMYCTLDNDYSEPLSDNLMFLAHHAHHP